ncbi:hypothetical protein [Caulobacter hibisci]|uniref:Uncharacterized protein n=1 Tax=Caulobacter hibisci TaxID=2035993 RepID=A0ABS0T0N9_9CAUL|nr:hypothetical protein [Caulobacter hibisci]MBI1684427.1 hypothetical protein [Caulobacter hibisci]
MAKLTVRELERSALRYAIREREALVHAIGDSTNPSDVRERERANALILGWKAMLKRRHGFVEAPPAGKAVDIFTLAAQSGRAALSDKGEG